MHSLRFLLRALWFRRGFSVALLLVSIATLGAAALGPVYARAVGESTLQDSLQAAGYNAGLHFAAPADLTPQNYQSSLRAVIAPGAERGFPTRITGFYTPDVVSVAMNGAKVVASHLAYRDGYCAHLTLLSGRCPSAAGEALVSEQTIADGYFGSNRSPELTITQNFSPAIATLKVVGIYRPKNTQDPYWFGGDYFNHQYAVSSVGDITDSIFVDPHTLSPKAGFRGEFEIDYPLDRGQVRLSDLGAVRASTLALQSRYTYSIKLTTGLPGILDHTAADRRELRAGTLLVTVQLALLAWLVLFEVVADAVEARGNEIALSKLRGHTVRATARFGLGEPLVFLALAVPLGLVFAYLVTRIMAGAALVRGVPVVVPWLAVGGALVGFTGGVLAAALAAARTLRRPVLDQWRRTEHSVQRGRASFVLDAVVALAALGGFIALHAQDRRHTSSLSLLAPGLLIVVVALLGVRLLPLFCCRLARRTRARRRVATFLASRQISRRRAGLRLAALLAVAVGLATFAVSGEAVAEHNRTERARAELGADRVLDIEPRPGHDPVEAVRAADPTGDWAMAAATWLPSGGGSVIGTVLGVDTARLAKVAYRASGGMTGEQVAAQLTAGAVPVIEFRGTQVRLTITTTDLVPGVPPDVQLNLRTAGNPYLNVEMQPLQEGTHTYTSDVACPRSCTLLGVTWDRPIDAEDPQGGTATISSMQYLDEGSWRSIDLQLGTPDSWSGALPQGQATDHVRVSRTGITDRFTNQNGGYGGVRYAIAPSLLPTVATPAAVEPNGASTSNLTMTDSFDVAAHYKVSAFSRVLPEVLDNGLIADITALRLSLPAFDISANWQVWLSPSAPADAVSRLVAAGVNVQDERTVAERVRVLGRQGPALALLLLLVCAVAGSALAVGATAVSITASGRRRSYELAALQAVGVRRSTLRRSAVIEQVLLMGTGVLLGVPAGVLGARLALPVIPEFSDTTPIAMDYLPSALPVLLLAGGLVLLLVLTAYGAARLLIRIAVPSRLREAE